MPAQEIEAGYEAFEARLTMLDVVLKTGNRHAFPYSYLLSAEYDPSKGITMHFSTHDVVVKGRNLEGLYGDLLAQRVPRVQSTAGRGQGNEDGLVVADICISPASMK